MSKITKTFTVERKGDWIVASTPAFDRDKDRVMPQGIDTTSFQKNPALFYGHNYTDPWAVAGRVAEWKIDGERMTFRPELREPVNESDPMTIIRSLWDAGLLRAASIGFIPRKGAKNEQGGMDFSEVELLEISLTPLPANQEALRLAMKALKTQDDPTPAEDVKEDVKDDMVALMDELRAIVADLRSLLQPQDAPQDATQDAPAAATDAPEAKHTTKRGRVLSAGNESKLRTAHTSIGDVLAQIGDDAPEQASKSVGEPAGKPAGEALADELADDEMKALAALLGDLPKLFCK